MLDSEIKKLLDVGIALSSEKDNDRLLEIILFAAMDLTSCDAGTLYINGGECLDFRVMVTKSMGVLKGGSRGEIELPPVPMAKSNVSACCALENRLINIADVYSCGDYDFSGTRLYDEKTGYRSQSFLVVPMENDYGEVIGVLQLINALDGGAGVVPFAERYEPLIRSIASQAAICLTRMNYAREITGLFNSFVRVMSTAIDARTPYNANHTRNMARYAQRFVRWLDESGQDWRLSENDKAQFMMSVWLHDVGKLVTPAEIMDKSSRLGQKTGEVELRFEVARLQNRLALALGEISAGEHAARARRIGEALELVRRCNGAGRLEDEDISRLRELCGGPRFINEGEPLLLPEELDAITVRAGTHTSRERAVMQAHVEMTGRILGQMAFSRNYAKAPGWAEKHHEYIDGSGYPRGLAGDELPKEVRLLTILDIYDALTAADRPYKAAMSADGAFGVLRGMAAAGKLDGDILEMFIASLAWKDDA